MRIAVCENHLFSAESSCRSSPALLAIDHEGFKSLKKITREQHGKQTSCRLRLNSKYAPLVYFKNRTPDRQVSILHVKHLIESRGVGHGVFLATSCQSYGFHVLQRLVFTIPSVASFRAAEPVKTVSCELMMAHGVTDNRIVAHFDVDCFYAQSEELRRPSLQGRPLGITQKFLVVTTNYAARGLGVPKMMAIDEAKRKCPELVLINGEDLTPYRADSKRIMAVLRRFGTVERRGLDEAAVEITAEVQRRLRHGVYPSLFSGCVLGFKTPLVHDGEGCINSEVNDKPPGSSMDLTHGDLLLKLGSHIVAEVRAAIEKETGFCCSCGIAHNKMLAKLACSVNKPNKQTCLLGSAVAGFLAPMPVTKIPGVGHSTGKLLNDIGVEKVSDLQKVSTKQLCQKFGDRIGVFLSNACRGYDHSLVQDKGPPKSISVEDSFKNCICLQRCKEIIRILAPDLVHRLDEDKADYGRRAKLFTVKWRVDGTKWNFSSASTHMPPELNSSSISMEMRTVITVDAAMKLLSTNFRGQSFSLRVLNIGATNFVNEVESTVSDIRPFFGASANVPGKEQMVVSKREARARRESYDRRTTVVSDISSSKKVPAFSSVNPSHLQKKDVNDGDMERSGTSTRFYDDVIYALPDCSKFQLADSFGSKRSPCIRSTIGLCTESLLSEEHGAELITQYTTLLEPKHLVSIGSSNESDKMTRITWATSGSSSAFKHNCGSEVDGVEVKEHLEAPSSSSLEVCESETFTLTSMEFGRASREGINIENKWLESSVVKSQEFMYGAGCSVESAIDVHGTAVMSPKKSTPDSRAPTCSSKWQFKCPKCGECVEDSDKRRQEHADFHFALELYQEGGSLLASHDSEPSENENQKSKKKLRLQNSTLDGFVYKL